MAVGNGDGTQLLDDAGYVRLGEEVIDDRAQGLQGRIGQGLHREPGQQALQVLEGRVAPVQAVQALVQQVQLAAVQVPIGQAAVQGIGGADLHAADSEIDPQLPGYARQEVTAANIREVTDGHLRHRQAAALGDYPQVGALHQAHAATQDKTVHQRQHRLAVVVDGQVKGIFLDEEVLVQAVAAVVTVVQRADIAAGAESLVPRATQDDGVDQRILGPVVQVLLQGADHRQGDGVEAGGAV